MIFRLMVKDGKGGDGIELVPIESDVIPPVGTFIYVENKDGSGASNRFVVDYHFWFIPALSASFPHHPRCFIYLTPITEESVNIPT